VKSTLHKISVFLSVFLFCIISGKTVSASNSETAAFNLTVKNIQNELLLQNRNISLRISDKLQLFPALKDSNRWLSFVAYSETSPPAFYITLDGEKITEIKADLDNYKKVPLQDELGRGWSVIINAEAQRKNTGAKSHLSIKMQLYLSFYEDFPFSVFSQVKYTNQGRQPIRIEAMVSNRFVIDRRLVDSTAASWDFASYQGVSLHWGRDYSLIRTLPDMKRKNFLGTTVMENGQTTGGGTPLIDLWTPQLGLALASAENKPQWISMPVNGTKDNRIEMAVVEHVGDKAVQLAPLKPGQSIRGIRTVMILHKLDYYAPLNTFAHILRQQGIKIQKISPPQAYLPYWKTWGLGMHFTKKQIYKELDVLKRIGIYWANLDDGWFTRYGDWEPNTEPGKFPGGETDMIAFVDSIHNKGFKTSLWWYPQGVSPQSKLAEQHPDWLVQNADGSFPKDTRGLYYLCPTYAPCIRFVEGMTEKILKKWGFDGLYLDTDAQNATPPCFNKAHHHHFPVESFQNQSQLYKAVYKKAQSLKPGCPIELCACARPHDPYKMPYYNVSTTSDPTTIEQVRRRVKVEKALHGPAYCVGDGYQIPMNEWDGYSVPESFESALGTGALVTTFFKDLNHRQEEKWATWVEKYKRLHLSDGEYLNLYDIAWDKPEAHVIKKDNKLYYAFYADYWSRQKPIILRGLQRNKTYKVRDYANDRNLGEIHGNNPVLKIAFKESLLLEVIPLDK